MATSVQAHHQHQQQQQQHIPSAPQSVNGSSGFVDVPNAHRARSHREGVIRVTESGLLSMAGDIRKRLSPRVMLSFDAARTAIGIRAIESKSSEGYALDVNGKARGLEHEWEGPLGGNIRAVGFFQALGLDYKSFIGEYPVYQDGPYVVIFLKYLKK